MTILIIIFKYFKRLKDDLIEFKNKEDNDNDRYIKLYEINAKNFDEIILQIDERQKRRKYKLNYSIKIK